MAMVWATVLMALLMDSPKPSKATATTLDTPVTFTKTTDHGTWIFRMHFYI
jgi:hypothetical protein